MNNMIAQLCDWTEDRTGQMIVGGVAVIAGAHLFLTANQSVLGFLDLSGLSFSIMGKEIGVQQVVGLATLVAGACVLGACCLPTGAMSPGSNAVNMAAESML
jgi:hypothetical protein